MENPVYGEELDRKTKNQGMEKRWSRAWGNMDVGILEAGIPRKLQGPSWSLPPLPCLEQRTDSPEPFSDGTASDLESFTSLSVLPRWSLPTGTGKVTLSSVRHRVLANLMKRSFSSGLSSLVLPEVKMVDEWITERHFVMFLIFKI